MQTTIKDVARAAGVSVATVSRVLANKAHVRHAVRERVRAAAEALNYRPNRAAQNFRARRSQFIGLIISDIENPFYTSMVRAVEDAAYAQQYSLLLCNSDEDPGKEQVYIEFMRDERVAGVIASPTEEAATSLQVLIDAGIPVVAIDRRSSRTPVDTILLDHVKSSYELTGHLIQHGHRRIGAIIGVTTSTSGQERMQGFRHAMDEAGIAVGADLIRLVKPTEETGYAAARALMTLPVPPTALFTGNNLLTVGALKALRALDLQIPRDVSLVGHDELPWMALLAPGITVSAQPIYEMGKQAVEMLLARIRGDAQPVREVRLNPTLIVRQSCARVMLEREGFLTEPAG